MSCTSADSIETQLWSVPHSIFCWLFCAFSRLGEEAGGQRQHLDPRILLRTMREYVAPFKALDLDKESGPRVGDTSAFRA